jgi:hypothetical protein
MRTGNQISTAALMGFIVLVALELVFFEGVWSIVLVPPVTMGALAINLGLLFLMVRPDFFETRIIGMMLGGLAACFATALAIALAFDIQDHVRNVLIDWASTLPIDQGLTVSVLRFVTQYLYVVYFALLDLMGVAMIWAGGWLQQRWYRRRAWERAPVASAVPPLDDCAATPL